MTFLCAQRIVRRRYTRQGGGDRVKMHARTSLSLYSFIPLDFKLS